MTFVSSAVWVSAVAAASTSSPARLVAGSWLRPAPPRRNQYANTGTIVIDTSSEAPSATATVIANGRKSSPTTPDTMATGANTVTVVSVDAVTAPATSLTEAKTSLGVSVRCPRSRRLMFSTTTIESSTTRPTATVSAARVKILREYSLSCRPIMAISSDSGIEIAVIKVARIENKKSKITSTAKARPSNPSTARSWIDCSINGAWSKMVVIVVLLPNFCSRLGILSRTWCEIATASASVSLRTARLRAGLPSARAMEVDSIDSTFTSATAESGTGFFGVGTCRARNCLTVLVAVPTSTASSRFLSKLLPAGVIVACPCTV